VRGLSQRFAADVAAVLGRDLAPGEAFAVAVSGGPDSLALLGLAADAFGERVCVLTVDHGLRAEAAAEAAGVADHAAGLGLRHATLRWTGAKPTGNLQAEARAARYRLMADWCGAHGVAWLATAHHADDQAETLLLRLARGAGSGGLAGIRRSRSLGDGVTLVRPLLGWRRDALAEVVAAAGWRAVDDPANHATRFDRTQARALLAATPWLAPDRMAAAAAHLADAEAALDWTAGIAWAGRATVSGAAIDLDAAGLPRELQRRLLVRVIAELAPSATPDGPAIDRWCATLSAGGSATLAGVAGRGGALWCFTVAPPRRK